MSFNRRIVVFVCLLIAAIANWVYPYLEYAQVRQTNVDVDSAILGTDKVNYSAAGWPWPFYHHFHCDGSSAWYGWDAISLLGDFLFWLMILVFAWFYSGTRRSNTKGSKTIVRWSLLDLLAMMLLIAITFGYVARMQSGYAESQKLIKSIRKSGGVASESHHSPNWLPNDLILSVLLPRDRISMVSLDNPTSSLLKEIVALPHLQSLRLSGSSYSLSDLQPLSNNPRLTELRLSGRELDPPTIQLIGRIKSLQALNLMHSNVTASDISALGEMPRLRYVHLGHTEVELRDSKLESWMRTVRYLRLPRPTKVASNEFRLDGWPELLDVQCMESDEVVDATPVRVLIANAPKLKTLTLVKSQRFDLHLSNLPLFGSIHELVGVGATTYTSRNWIRSVDFKNLPSLAVVKFNIRDFESIRIEDCPQLECDTTPFDSPASTSILAAQQLVAGVGRSIGITSLNLLGLPLEQLDLSPIAACSTIKRLHVPIVANSNSKLQSLSALNAMEELIIYGAFSPMPEKTVSNLLRIWPSLKRIEGALELSSAGQSRVLKMVNGVSTLVPLALPRIPSVYPNAVRLESATNLESFMNGDFWEAPSIVLKDLPQYTDSVQTSRELRSIHIGGSPKLKGLLTYALWPKDASIDGLSELEIFSAGGPQFQDKDFTGIEASTSLKSLTLGYCGMTAERLSAIGKFTKLQSLGLTGSAVTDETVQNWANLQAVRNLMLDHTQISSASIPWICTLRSLEHLSINADCLASVTQEQLVKLSSLHSLTLFGDGSPWGSLSELVKWKTLSTLKIENATLTKEILVQLENCLPKSIRILDLCNCRVDLNDLDEFLPAIPSNISLGVEGLELSVEMKSFLQSSFRAVIEDDSDFFLLFGNNYSFRSSEWPTRRPSDSRSKSTSSSANFLSITSIVTGQATAPFVKPSLFAPAPTSDASSNLE